MSDAFNDLGDLFKKWDAQNAPKEPAAKPPARPEQTVIVYPIHGEAEEFENAQVADVGSRLIIGRENNTLLTVFMESAISSYEVIPVQTNPAPEADSE